MLGPTVRLYLVNFHKMSLALYGGNHHALSSVHWQFVSQLLFGRGHLIILTFQAHPTSLQATFVAYIYV